MINDMQKKEIFTKELILNVYSKNLGIQLKDLQPDKVVLEMLVTPDKHKNHMGIVHGGAITSLADTAMGIACIYQGYMVSTIDLNINFIRRATPEGTLLAEAKVIHHGRQTMVAETEIYDENEKLVAKARGTFFVIDSPK